MSLDAIGRFMAKVHRPDDAHLCWTWIGSTHGQRQPRGHFWATGRRWDAARWLYQRLHPTTTLTGKVIMHRCDNSLCVNPDHLTAGTQADNVRDMHAKGRSHHQTDPTVQVRAISAANATMAQNPRLRARGERHGLSKLSDREREIIGASDEATAVLAERYGVHRTRIQRIRAAALRALATSEPS